jgi:hypothetical protein
MLNSVKKIPNLVWGVLALMVLVFLFFTGRKAGIDKARKENKVEPLPDGGKSMGDWGTNPTNPTALKYAIDLAKQVFDVLDGAWVTSPVPSQDRRLNAFILLYSLGNDQLTSVYNQYNLNHGQKFWGLTFVSMTEAIDNEVLLYGGDIQDKLVNRLKSLKLK